MRYVIIYYSRFGNNKKIVEHLAQMLGKKGEVKVFKTGETNPAALPLADVYVFSAAAEKFSLQEDMKTFMQNLQGMEGRKYAIINTHALSFKNWLGRMEKLLSTKGMVKVAQIDFRMGAGREKGNGLAEGWETKLEKFAGNI